MAYTVYWKALPGKAVIRTEVYEDREQAIVEADVAAMSGPHPVEVTVIDEAGREHFFKVIG